MKLRDLLSAQVDTTINKNTFNDKRRILSDSIERIFQVDGSTVYSWLMDFDDDYVYFEIYDSQEGRYRYWRATYEFSGTSATFGEEAVEVVKLTEWKVIESDVDKSFTDKVVDVLDKYFGGAKEGKVNIPVIKQFNNEQMVSIEPLYIGLDDVDGHGWAFENQDVINKMVESFNKAVEDGRMQTGMFHKHLTEGFSINKAWTNPCDCTIGDTFVKAGDPLVELQYHSETLWEKRKSGEIAGPSIGAKGTVVSLEDE